MRVAHATSDYSFISDESLALAVLYPSPHAHLDVQISWVSMTHCLKCTVEVGLQVWFCTWDIPMNGEGVQQVWFCTWDILMNREGAQQVWFYT